MPAYAYCFTLHAAAASDTPAFLLFDIIIITRAGITPRSHARRIQQSRLIVRYDVYRRSLQKLVKASRPMPVLFISRHYFTGGVYFLPFISMHCAKFRCFRAVADDMPRAYHMMTLPAAAAIQTQRAQPMRLASRATMRASSDGNAKCK